MNILYWVSGFIGILLIIYLVVALLRPEIFSD